jgi:hypothetical protein
VRLDGARRPVEHRAQFKAGLLAGGSRIR